MSSQRIYLACTVRGDRGGVSAGRHLVSALKARGHSILTEHLLRDDVETMESALSSEEIFRRDMEWLTSADAIVAEASASTYGVGFEVGYCLARARETGQRIFLLYDIERLVRISRLIPGNTHPHCTRIPYQSTADLQAFVREYF